MPREVATLPRRNPWTDAIDQYAANAGAPMIINAEQFGPKVVDWVSCIAENYGQQALQDAGVISGFKVNGEVTDISDNTAETSITTT